MFNPSDHLADFKSIVKDAAKVAMPYWGNKDAVKYKADGSPVTLADPASEDVILPRLKDICPGIPVVSEEQFEAGKSPDISNAREYWLVDPLDGTKEFIKGTEDFTINIGLIRDGVPVFGFVYLPATDDLYYGGVNIGSFLNGSKIATQPYNIDIGLMMIGSKMHPNPKSHDMRDGFLKGNKVSSYIMRGSSVKFCMIAGGEAHLYPRFVPTYEWDTCAAHAILLEAGGDIIDFETGQRLKYGKPKHLNGAMVTGTNQVLSILNPSLSDSFSKF